MCSCDSFHPATGSFSAHQSALGKYLTIIKIGKRKGRQANIEELKKNSSWISVTIPLQILRSAGLHLRILGKNCRGKETKREQMRR